MLTQAHVPDETLMRADSTAALFPRVWGGLLHTPHAVVDFNQSETRNVAIFSADFFVSHAGITNNGSAHTDSVRFCRFGFNRPTAKWLYGCLQGNRLRTLSSSNL